MKKVSIIVTNYNGKAYLEKCLNSLLAQTYPEVEIILSDDASFDGSVDFVRENFKQVKLALNCRNSGLSVTSNNGAKLATGDYLFFFNNDTVAFADLIVNLVKAIESEANAAMAYPVQLPYDNSLDDEWIRLMEEQRGFSACGVDIYGNPCPAFSEEKIFYPDAAIFIKKEVFDEIGGFDPDFYLYGEDVDICWRVHLMGYKIVYAPEAKFRHDSGCMQMENKRVVTSLKRRKLVERQVINMLLKYYRPGTLIKILPKFTVCFTAEALFFLVLKLNYQMFFQVYLAALWWNLKRLNKTLQKRKFIQKIRREKDRDIMNKMYHGYAKLDGVRRMGIPIIR